MALTFNARSRTLVRSLIQFRSKSSIPNFTDSDIVNGSETPDGIRGIEDLLRSIYAEKSAPDWIHFVPGSSYWVPPHKATSVAASHIYRIARSNIRVEEEEEEEIVEFKTSRGWPSKHYFLQGDSEQAKKIASHSDDEE